MFRYLEFLSFIYPERREFGEILSQGAALREVSSLRVIFSSRVIFCLKGNILPCSEPACGKQLANRETMYVQRTRKRYMQGYVVIYVLPFQTTIGQTSTSQN